MPATVVELGQLVATVAAALYIASVDNLGNRHLLQVLVDNPGDNTEVVGLVDMSEPVVDTTVVLRWSFGYNPGREAGEVPQVWPTADLAAVVAGIVGTLGSIAGYLTFSLI